MKVSVRGVEAQASPIRRLAPYADEAARSGAKVYYLNIGQPDLPTPDIVMDRIRSYPGKYVPYSPSAGTATPSARSSPASAASPGVQATARAKRSSTQAAAVVPASHGAGAS